MKLNPHLANADRAFVYFDRRRNPTENLGGGRWVTVVKVGHSVFIDVHLSQAEAYEFIGLEGGRSDESYRPAPDDTGYALAVGAGV